MQILIDTETDSPERIYRISTFLRSISEAPEVPAQEAAGRPADWTKSTASLSGIDMTDRPERNEIVVQLARANVKNPPPAASAAVHVQQVIDSLAAPALAEQVYGDDADVEVEVDDAPPPPALFPGTLTTAGGLSPPPPPAAVPPGPAVEPPLDSRRMPWDSRIHASNRATKIDGSWKYKRGTSADLIVAVEAQNKPGNVQRVPILVGPYAGMLREDVPAAAPSPPPPPPAADTAPTPPPPATPPVAGIVAPAAVVPSAIDFRGLMQKIQKASAAGKLTPDQVNAALAGVGLQPEEMAQLINNAPLIASVNAAVEQCLSS